MSSQTSTNLSVDLPDGWGYDATNDAEWRFTSPQEDVTISVRESGTYFVVMVEQSLRSDGLETTVVTESTTSFNLSTVEDTVEQFLDELTDGGMYQAISAVDTEDAGIDFICVPGTLPGELTVEELSGLTDDIEGVLYGEINASESESIKRISSETDADQSLLFEVFSQLADQVQHTEPSSTNDGTS